VTEDEIRADYHDGVLEIHVTKPEQPKPRRIEIGGGDHKTIERKASKASAHSLGEGGSRAALSLVGERLLEPGLREELA
jgi:Hsp20/alpha crystallin family